MRSSPHPLTERLARAMQRCLGQTLCWSGTVYRGASPKYASKEDLLVGAGSRKYGARWNAPGSCCAVYTSLDPHTALDEILAHYRYYQLPLESALPKVTVAVKIHLQKVIDLLQGTIRHILAVSLERLLQEPWREEQKQGREALTQALGRLAWQAGIQGLLVPSAARKDGVNLVIFPDNLDIDCRLTIINVAHLPHKR